MSLYLTKSRFRLACECPTKLFYSGFPNLYKNKKQEDSFLKVLAEGGFQVGELAKLLYCDAIEITEKDNNLAVERTLKLLNEHSNITLLEAAIRYGDYLVKIDVLIKRNNTFELIEVKAKSYNSKNPEIKGLRQPILKPMRPYIEDVAFQKYVLGLAFPDAAISSYLMMPDKSVLSEVDGINQMFKIDSSANQIKVSVDPKAVEQKASITKLLAKVPVDEFVEVIFRDGIKATGKNYLLNDLSERFAEAHKAKIKMHPVLTSACSKCEFSSVKGGAFKSGFHECLETVTKWKEEDLNKLTVLDIWDFRKKDEFLGQGVYRPSQLTQEDIGYKEDKEGLSRTQRQWLQCQGIPSYEDKGGFYFDTELFSHKRSSWKYPYHLIDFETSTTALPFFSGMHPYEAVAFQFSHHLLYEDGTVEHVGEFLLADEGVFPNYEFARALKKQLENDEGTIFRWAHHENTILNHIISQLKHDKNRPEDSEAIIEFLTHITKDGDRKMVDLNELALRTYYHPDTKARTSIKKVLPAVLKTSEFLKSKYAEPIYGHTMKSINFKNFTWLQMKDGEYIEPYDLLKNIEKEMVGEIGTDIFDTEDEGFEIAEGGAAAAAYARLQFESLSNQQKKKIKDALLRYCELDTLAMAMILEAWIDWSTEI